MKDLPALLCAVLSVRSPGLMAEIFDRVIEDGRMLRNFVQIMRSGVVGRKSLGTLPKRMILQWLENHSDDALFRASVGNDPSLVDIIKMMHPKPQTESRKALFGYLLGREFVADQLPPLVREYEAFKNGQLEKAPNVPFQMLTNLPLSKRHWQEIARNAPWQMTRMNLNTFARHDVFTDRNLVREIANRLRNRENIAKAKVFPYQLMVAYTQTDSTVPSEIRDALQDAMEIAVSNVPAIEGKVYVCPDVSGSMRSAITGHRPGATSAVKCVDVAALVAAAVLRQNRTAEVLPFEHSVVNLRLNGRDSVMTNAQKLASIGGGGTNCSAPLALLNERRAEGDLVIFISDNESWVDAARGRGTAMMQEWEKFRVRNRSARLVCLDIQPYGTTQAKERDDVLNIGGFSDRVFEIVADFAAGRLRADHWVGVIESERL
jgi:60 kDa SS-A/Ro ribonucleoprotein